MISNMLPHEKDIVLIVDDTAANHEVIQTVLSDIGVKCENAFDGMEAVTMCGSVESDYYSLILMDINLPCMDGLATTQRIRQLGVTSPIIAVTAASRDEEKIKSAETDELFDLLLFKPFNAAAFYTTISPYIKSATLHSLSPDIISAETCGFSSLDPEICDIHTAIDNMGNSPRLFMKHFNNFKNNNADLSLRLTALIEKRKFYDAAMLCHSIKGLSGMLGLTSLYRHVVELETILKGHASEGDCTPAGLSDMSRMLALISDDVRLICQVQL